MNRSSGKSQKALVVASLLTTLGIFFVILGLGHFSGVIHYYDYTHDKPYETGINTILRAPLEGVAHGWIEIDNTFTSRIGVISAGIPVDFYLNLTITQHEGFEEVGTVYVHFRTIDRFVGHISGTRRVVLTFNTSGEKDTFWDYKGEMTFARPGNYGLNIIVPGVRPDIFSLEEYPNSFVFVADSTIGSQQLFNNNLFGLMLVTLGVPWFQIAISVYTRLNPPETVVQNMPKQKSSALQTYRLRKNRGRRR